MKKLTQKTQNGREQDGALFVTGTWRFACELCEIARYSNGALDGDGLAKNRIAIAEDVIGANEDHTQG